VNCKPFVCAFLIGSAVFAADLSGRYQGLASGKKADGTGPERKLFVILRLENNAVYCSAGLDSFERQIPCEDPAISGDEVKFGTPWGGGVVFELKVKDQQELVGGLHTKPGLPPAPYHTVTLKRVGDLTLSDYVPRLTWEDDERSHQLLQLRKSLIDGRSEALSDFWKAVEKSGSPVVEAANSESSFLITFVWKGTPETKNVLLIWPRLTFARPDSYFSVACGPAQTMVQDIESPARYADLLPAIAERSTRAAAGG